MPRFLRDRAAYVAASVGFALTAVGVVQLDLLLHQSSLDLPTILYIGLLGFVGLAAFLTMDWLRQAEFMRRLEGVNADEPLDQLGLLPEPKTREQEAFARAWTVLYGRLRAELTAEQERGRRNVHLVSQWAHHMKTPVAVIDLELQKARQQPCPPELEAVLTSVAEENDRQRHSLQMLLNVVRLEDFAADFRVEPVDLVVLVRRLVNDRKREFIASRVYPKVDLPEGMPVGAYTVESDAKWLRFVLDQVLSNAIKYASGPDREGQVTFRCCRDGADTVLEVADNGIGIPPEDLGRVFEPFFTGVNGRSHPLSTGMGLYLAREACQRLGHRISLESRRGEGTRVFVRCPANPTIFAGLSPSLTER